MNPVTFKIEVHKLADDIGVSIKEIHIRNMKTKWASCSSKGRLTFNSQLLNTSKRKRSEIILHELLHLRYPNHGKMFKLMLNNYSRKLENNI